MEKAPSSSNAAFRYVSPNTSPSELAPLTPMSTYKICSQLNYSQEDDRVKAFVVKVYCSHPPFLGHNMLRCFPFMAPMQWGKFNFVLKPSATVDICIYSKLGIFPRKVHVQWGRNSCSSGDTFKVHVGTEWICPSSSVYSAFDLAPWPGMSLARTMYGSASDHCLPRTDPIYPSVHHA